MPEDKSDLVISGNVEKCTIKVQLLGSEKEVKVPCNTPLLEAIRENDREKTQSILGTAVKEAFQEGVGLDVGRPTIDWENAEGL